jgi:hypothetical protein
MWGRGTKGSGGRIQERHSRLLEWEIGNEGLSWRGKGGIEKFVCI